MAGGIAMKRKGAIAKMLIYWTLAVLTLFGAIKTSNPALSFVAAWFGYWTFDCAKELL